MKPLKPFSPPKSLKTQGGSTILWKTPQPTDVLSYAYLWAREAALGRDDAAKDRPVVVVLATITREHIVEVVVAPVTTQPPRSSDDSVEMPSTVKANLGLDDQRCWIMTSEVNRFIWPGPDIRPINKREGRSPYYGKIPAKLLEAMRVKIQRQIDAGRFSATKRTQ
jgi:hypothetical protein